MSGSTSPRIARLATPDKVLDFLKKVKDILAMRQYEWLMNRLAAPFGDGCVEWPFSLNASGYGQVCRHYETLRAHRIVCEMFHGKPSKKRCQAAHSCGNRVCFNPRHLRWASPKENHADKIAHGTHLKGEDIAQAKLSKAQVAEMRRLYNSDEATQIELAYRFGLTMAATNRIVTGKSYTDGFDPIALAKRTHKYPTPRTFTREQIRDICARYESGETQGEIAASFGMQSASIGRVLKRKGLK
jgi:DNA-binding MarR family transcriptional regulator